MIAEIKKLLSFRDSDIKKLAKLDSHVIRETLSDIFEVNQGQGWVDSDRLNSIGRILRLADHDELDGFVENWLQPRCASRSLEVASSFLIGYWSTRREVSETLINMLLDYLARFEADAPARDMALMALCDVPGSAAATSAKLRVCEVLGRYLARAASLQLHPGVQEPLRQALRERQGF